MPRNASGASALVLSRRYVPIRRHRQGADSPNSTTWRAGDGHLARQHPGRHVVFGGRRTSFVWQNRQIPHTVAHSSQNSCRFCARKATGRLAESRALRPRTCRTTQQDTRWRRNWQAAGANAPILCPVKGMLPSLGPGLRTVTGAKRRLCEKMATACRSVQSPKNLAEEQLRAQRDARNPSLSLGTPAVVVVGLLIICSKHAKKLPILDILRHPKSSSLEHENPCQNCSCAECTYRRMAVRHRSRVRHSFCRSVFRVRSSIFGARFRSVSSLQKSALPFFLKATMGT